MEVPIGQYKQEAVETSRKDPQRQYANDGVCVGTAVGHWVGIGVGVFDGVTVGCE